MNWFKVRESWTSTSLTSSPGMALVERQDIGQYPGGFGVNQPEPYLRLDSKATTISHFTYPGEVTGLIQM